MTSVDPNKNNYFSYINPSQGLHGNEITMEEKKPECLLPFFEHNSKYFSLSQFKETLSGTDSSHKRKAKINQGDYSIFTHQFSDQSCSVKKWFEKLSLSDKTIVLTTVDL
mmetsp:Transcript_3330/g.3302  ORF Transcript_3330/g.3302 Transcript_3330/m.3302 type:complete len:110 (-) Transcript_3330:524-853(-)